MSDVVAEPIQWLWRERFARGKVSIIAGNPGLGKSQVTISMAAIVSRGGDWPIERMPCERGNVILLTSEDDAATTIKPRLTAAGADMGRVFILDSVNDVAPDVRFPLFFVFQGSGIKPLFSAHAES